MNSILELIDRHAAEIPEWGHLPAAMRFKQSAVASLGVSQAFELCREHLGVPGIDTVMPRRIVSMLGAGRDRAIEFTLLWDGGGEFVRPPARVIGDSNNGPLPGVDRSGFLACFADAQIRGRSSVVLCQGDALVDFEGSEYDRLDDNPEYDPGVLASDAETLWMMEPAVVEVQVEEAFMLSGSHTVDFGHWMAEYLPRYALAVLAGLPPHVPVLVDQNIPQTMREALAQLLPPGTQVITIEHLSCVRVRRLWCASNPYYSSFYATEWPEDVWSHIGAGPRRFASLIRELTRLLTAEIEVPTGEEKIFLARKPSRFKKKLLNHLDIEALARRRGFKVLYPEDYSFVEQVRLATHARWIMAPEGSNGLLSYFARPGCRVCVLSPPYTLPLVDISAVLDELGIDMTVITGPERPDPDNFCPYWNDYRIDESALAGFLDQWLGPGSASIE